MGTNFWKITHQYYKRKRFLEFIKTNDLLAINIFGSHKNSRIQTWHSPGCLYHNQIDYILVSKRFYMSVNVNKTR